MYTLAPDSYQAPLVTRTAKIIHSDANPLFVDLSMSESTPTTLSSFSPIFHATFEASLKEYEKKTEKSLITHPLMAQLQACKSRAAILELLRSQAEEVEQTTSTDDKLIKWLDPIVNVLSASSSVITACVGLVNTIQIFLLRFTV